MKNDIKINRTKYAALVLIHVSVAITMALLFPLLAGSLVSPDGKGSYIDTHMHLNPSSSVSDEDRGAARKAGPGSFPPGPGPRRGQSRRDGDRSSGTAAATSAAAQLVALMDEHGVNKSLIVVVPSHRNSPEEDYNSARAAIAAYPDRLFLMAGGSQLGTIMRNTPPESVNTQVREQFTRIAHGLLDDGAAGFGEMMGLHLCMSATHSYQFVQPDHPLFLLLADIAAERDVPIDLHCEAVSETIATARHLLASCDKNPQVLPATIPAIERLLLHNRKARIVWQHIGWDNTEQMTAKVVGGMLVRHPNLYIALRVEARALKIGTTEPMPNRIVDGDGKIRPEWREIINSYPDRVMIGSDEFIGGIGGRSKAPQSFEETWPILDQLSDTLAKMIGHGNPARVYGL